MAGPKMAFDQIGSTIAGSTPAITRPWRAAVEPTERGYMRLAKPSPLSFQAILVVRDFSCFSRLSGGPSVTAWRFRWIEDEDLDLETLIHDDYDDLTLIPARGRDRGRRRY